MKKYLLIISGIVLSIGGNAQNSIDALRYSKMQQFGTARFNAMGGAFTALGGDHSAIVINPAAIGIYRSSEFTLTPTLLLNEMNSSYRGNTPDEQTNNFNIGNIGYVGSYTNDPNGWKYASFAIGHNRISNFHGDYTHSGTADASIIGSTIIDGYIHELNNDQANEANVLDYYYPFGPSQAYNTYMIDPDGNSYSYTRGLGLQSLQSVNQNERNYVKGKQSETYFSFGGNYQDRLFLGANIAFQNVTYERIREYSETYEYQATPNPNDSNYVPLNYNEKSEQYTYGSGVNLKIGAIYKITDELRVGASIHTPTWISLSENYIFNAHAELTAIGNLKTDKIDSKYDYQINTPWRYNAGLAYIINNKAALSFDYEFVNYASARIKDNQEFPFDYSPINQEIKNQLKGAHNFRVGAEVNLNPFVLRAGYRYEDNPFANKNFDWKLDESRNTFSVGTGFRSNNYSIDLTYMRSDMSIVDPVYSFNDEVANIERIDSRIMLTLGWKW